jgi:hypothetical protein
MKSEEEGRLFVCVCIDVSLQSRSLKYYICRDGFDKKKTPLGAKDFYIDVLHRIILLFVKFFFFSEVRTASKKNHDMERRWKMNKPAEKAETREKASKWPCLPDKIRFGLFLFVCLFFFSTFHFDQIQNSRKEIFIKVYLFICILSFLGWTKVCFLFLMFLFNFFFSAF